MDNNKCPEGFIVNLHGPYDLVFVSNQQREYTFDKSGRLLWIMLGERRIERSLSNRFVEKWDLGPEHIYRKNRVLDRAATLATYHQLQDDLAAILSRLRSGQHCGDKCLIFNHGNQVQSFLQLALSWDYRDSSSETRKFSQVYSPIEIFPTDIPQPLVVQLTQGCSYNKCTFCGFYKHKQYIEKTLPQVESHLEDIKAFMGHSLVNKRNIFLADANALTIEQPLLLQMFDLINAAFCCGDSYAGEASLLQANTAVQPTQMQGIYSFIDACTQKSVGDFGELRARNLRKVYLGLETGSDALLQFVKKCNTAQEMIQQVRAVKAGGVSVGLMVMLGLGGQQHSQSHVERTLWALNQMNLDRTDSVHFSHLVYHPHASYQRDAQRAGLVALSYEEEEQQMKEMVEGLDIPLANLPHIKGYEVENVRF